MLVCAAEDLSFCTHYLNASQASPCSKASLNIEGKTEYRQSETCQIFFIPDLFQTNFHPGVLAIFPERLIEIQNEEFETKSSAAQANDSTGKGKTMWWPKS